METIIYILAIIGGINVISVFTMLVVFVITNETGENTDESERGITCALTDEHCIYTSEKGSCYGCPVAEEAEKIGNR